MVVEKKERKAFQTSRKINHLHFHYIKIRHKIASHSHPLLRQLASLLNNAMTATTKKDWRSNRRIIQWVAAVIQRKLNTKYTSCQDPAAASYNNNNGVRFAGLDSKLPYVVI
jgi:hypothetical protein